MKDFKNLKFCKNFAEEFYEKNSTKDPEAYDATIIRISEDEKEKFKSLIKSLNNYSANFLVYYLINYSISHSKDQVLANKIISKFWLDTFERAEAKDVYDKERISTILEHFCLVKIQNFFDSENNHMLIHLNFYPDLYKKIYK